MNVERLTLPNSKFIVGPDFSDHLKHPVVQFDIIKDIFSVEDCINKEKPNIAKSLMPEISMQQSTPRLSDGE